MPHSDINWLAILVAAIIPMVVGGLWYSNMLFAKQWMALMGKTEEEIKKDFNPARTYGITFVMCIVMAYVMDYFVHYTMSATFLQGAKIGFALWLGMAVTTAYQSVTFQGVKQGLYTMNMGYNLVSMLLMGGVLAVWK
ncbi:MAG: DUF1761 domain-containing protein [Bacteroidota bacterium]|jgi:hypothetical protein